MRLLQDWVTDQAWRRPDARAVVGTDAALTYRELEEASSRLARLLHRSGCRRGDRVCFLIPKSPMAIVAMVAALKADAMYVPLDPEAPVPRLQRIIESCDDRWILAAGDVAAPLQGLAGTPGFETRHAVGWLGSVPPPDVKVTFRWDEVAAEPAESPANGNSPSDGAHILFTSGSTGTPKGVVVTHGSVRQFVEWAVGYFGTRGGERLSGHPPLHFDLSTFDIFGAFAAGAELHLVPPELNVLPHQLATFIRNRELTQWFSVPSVLNYMAKFDAVRWNDFPALRRVLWCGEVLPTSALRYWMERLPDVSFTNLYGPTETTIASSYYTVPSCPPSDDTPIPIGRGCPGEELVILDADLHPASAGEIGEIWIGGGGVSPGYWRDPERTDQAFLRDPRGRGAGRLYRTGDLGIVDGDGVVQFVGRVDSQVKSRGYRVELGEVELAVQALGRMRECAVVGVATEGFEGTAICCAYVPLEGAEPGQAELRSALAATLPRYMVPSRWARFDVLPKTSNGKVDRRQLREHFAGLRSAIRQ